MPDILPILGVSVVIPAILEDVYAEFNTCYRLYNDIRVRRAQIGLLLERSSRLVLDFARSPLAKEEPAPDVRQAADKLKTYDFRTDDCSYA